MSQCRAALHTLNPEATFTRLSGGTGAGIAAPLDTVRAWVEHSVFATARAAALRTLFDPLWDHRFDVCMVACVLVRVCACVCMHGCCADFGALLWWWLRACVVIVVVVCVRLCDCVVVNLLLQTAQRRSHSAGTAGC